jgi:hypothetical protein
MTMSTRDRRLLIGIGAFVVVVAVWFLFLHKSPKATETISPLPQVGQGVPSPAPSPTKGKHKRVLVFSGRDPFCCDPTTNAVASTSPGSGVVPAGTPSSGPSGGSSATFNGQTVVLVDIFVADGNDQAQVEVDGTVYTVSPGDNFAGDFTLVSISGTCADFTFQSESFTLCETANK